MIGRRRRAPRRGVPAVVSGTCDQDRRTRDTHRMPDRSLIDVVRAAVADVAPDELADFEDVARGYAASAAKRGWPWHTESTPSASVGAGEPVAALVTAVGGRLGRDVALLGPPTVRRRAATLWSRLSGRTTIDLD